MDDLTNHNPGLFQERVKQLENGGLDFVVDIIVGETVAEKLSSSTFYLTLIGFSVIHLLAWNWEFPTPLIEKLWRWFNIGAAAVSILPMPGIVVLTGIVTNDGVAIFVVAIGIVYALLRLGVLGLTFYCLSSMPERAYTTMDWLAWIPHFS